MSFTDDLHRIHTSAGANPSTGEPLPSLLSLLRQALEPGTARRWSERDLTETEAERQDAESFKDRAAAVAAYRAGIDVPGFTTAPLRVDVADVLANVEGSLAELEDAVCDRLGLTPTPNTSPDERARRVGEDLAPVVADIPDLAEHVASEAARLAREARRAIGDREPVNKLRGRCPVCESTSLRAFPEREVVLCVNADCRCDDPDCRCGDEDRPARHRWHYDEWPWLAQLLADETELAA